MRQKDTQKTPTDSGQGTRRIAEIDRLIEKVFEQNASGILSDERFSKMLQSYEKEQKALIQEVADSQKALQEAKQKVTDLRLLLRTLRELTDITELTPTLVNALIERIEVHNNDKSSGHCFVKVDIYFTAAGNDRYSYRTGNPCYDEGNTGKPAGLPLCSITKEYGATHFTE